MLSIQFTVGIGSWSEVRDFLRAAVFMGRKIEWIESSGWIERVFTVRGDPADIVAVQAALMRWQAWASAGNRPVEHLPPQEEK